ncbi:hypothetical protein KHC27_02475 [Ancylobacter lacus]|nr:hypothetical protein [Ancylobacter lacus]
MKLVEDAVRSSSDAGHNASMSLCRSRLAEQIETATGPAVRDVAGPAPATASGTSP